MTNDQLAKQIYNLFREYGVLEIAFLSPDYSTIFEYYSNYWEKVFQDKQTGYILFMDSK